jgi:hypothetical protein
MLGKKEGESCPFFDCNLPGCRIHSVKPQVCVAALYLSKMNLLICEEQKKINDFPICSADKKLRARIADFKSRLDEDAKAKSELERLFDCAKPEVELFLLLLRLKGMEIYFGNEKATLLARRLGLARVPVDEAMGWAVFLFLAGLLSERKESQELSIFNNF